MTAPRHAPRPVARAGTDRPGRAGALAALAALAALGPGPARAQDEGGIQVALTVSPQLVYSTEAEGLGFRTGFALVASDATRNQRVRLEAATAFEQALGGGGGDGFDGLDTPALRLAYDYEVRSTAIGIDATYSSTDVDDDFVDPLTGFLILDDGERTAYGLGTDIQFGRDAPLSGTLVARRDWVDYEGTTDPRLTDSVTDRLGLALVFRVDPRIEVTVSGDVLDQRAEGLGTDRRLAGLGVGAALAVTPTLTATAQVRYDRTETVRLGRRDVEDGIGLSLGAVLDRPNGAYTAQVSSRVTENGRRARLDVGRSLALPNGELSVGVGLQETGGGGVDPLLSLAYAQETARGRLTAAAQQVYTTDIDGDEAIASTLSLGYARELGPLDTLAARFVLQDNAVQTGTGTDARRAELGVTYTRALAQDWSLVAGASVEREDRAGRGTDDDGEVFLGLEKTFLWRD